MDDLRGKIAIIAVDYLAKDGLIQGDPVEILDQREEPFFLDQRVIKLKARSLRHPNVEREIFRSEVVSVRDRKSRIQCLN